jgi:biopolymer transport protein ExbD
VTPPVAVSQSNRDAGALLTAVAVLVLLPLGCKRVSRDKGRTVTAPTPVAVVPPPDASVLFAPRGPHAAHVLVRADGTAVMDGTAVTDEQLGRRCEALVKAFPDEEVTVLSDPNAGYGRVNDVVQTIGDAGIDDVAYLGMNGPPIDAGVPSAIAATDDAGRLFTIVALPSGRLDPLRQIVLHMHLDGSLALAGIPTTKSDLATTLAPYLAPHPEWVEIIVMGSERLPYSDVNDVLHTLKEAGVRVAVVGTTP